MSFKSLEFALLLTTVFLLYWNLGRRWQNNLLLVASYTFYGWFDYRFLSLIFGVSLATFLFSILVEKQEGSRRKQLLVLGILCNLGTLGVFKYYDFFAGSVNKLLTEAGWNVPLLEIALPLGISFFTFQATGYLVDVFRGKYAAERNLRDFLLFISFFPQLVAGPIERGKNLLPQIKKERQWKSEEVKEGLRLILWGLFKKIVIADRLSVYVDATYNNPESTGSALLVATYFFAFQIYCDFSAYSDIARGAGRMLGIKLMVNFRYPLFSRRINEFWNRWHISLMSWFRDYLYWPIYQHYLKKRGAFSDLNGFVLTLFVFLISGAWHGAGWTYILWGVACGLFFLGDFTTKTLGIKSKNPPMVPSLKETPAMLRTVHAWILTLPLFRANSIDDFWLHLQSFSSNFQAGELLPILQRYYFDVLLILCLITIEWLQRRKEHPLKIEKLPLPARWCAYLALSLAILLFGHWETTPFIYFQF